MPANKNVAEGDLILIIAFSQVVDVFTRFFFFFSFSVTQEGKDEAVHRNLRTGVYGRSGTDLGLDWFSGRIRSLRSSLYL